MILLPIRRLFLVPLLLFFGLGPAAGAAEEGEGYEMAPPIFYPKPRSAPSVPPVRAPAPSAPADQPAIRYKQPKPPVAPVPDPVGPTTLFRPIRGSNFAFWECDRSGQRDVLSMRAQDRSCQDLRTVDGRNMSTLNAAFARHIDKHLYRCVANAAERAGLPRPAKIEIGNMSGLRPGDDGRYKFHGRGRALDIGRVRLLDKYGRPIPTGIRSMGGADLAIRSGEIMLHEQYYVRDRTTQRFYDSFRSCWKESLRGCDSTATIGTAQSPGTTSPGHHNHIHIQFPERCGR